ncbi:MAG: alternative ribosome rescue aminoacyl-tRNA hydrolase ArfB [bacterium]|nr:alternative ribosome rescue aminoacyl-tRNA hydrolase ArfB [bacterium]
MLVVNRRIHIPLREFHFQFARSGGAGGQNVNKVNTKAILRWAVSGSPSLPADVRDRFCERYRRRITREGELVLASQRFRDQGRNVADCLEKLRQLIEEVATAPKRRRPTRPTKAAKERRLGEKHRLSEKKKRRGHIRGEE